MKIIPLYHTQKAGEKARIYTGKWEIVKHFMNSLICR